ncbi:MAG: tRNA pseudouridine(38-40) synthase TruA [Candidatus Omnitrophica bacterium]|nr:tRNA pseudouridine(38-40) synthase TruA [Candidatus Omnitrophota bacterium]
MILRNVKSRSSLKQATGRNIKLEIEYDGSNYAGWQVQPKSRGKTIQKIIEKTLQGILQERVKLIASGRTDAGVHALGQVANFYTYSKLPLVRLKIALNGLLPADVKIVDLKNLPYTFHSRFSAKAKVYRYTILNRDYSSPLLRNRVYFYPHPLNARLMQKEAKVLLGKHDFSAFVASQGKEKNPVRTIRNISVIREKDFILINIEADGFLYNMVRNIVGTLINVGCAKCPEGKLKQILLSKDRSKAGFTAPSVGLCLMKVKY